MGAAKLQLIVPDCSNIAEQGIVKQPMKKMAEIIVNCEF
jgi:hypothetical protein